MYLVGANQTNLVVDKPIRHLKEPGVLGGNAPPGFTLGLRINLSRNGENSIIMRTRTTSNHNPISTYRCDLISKLITLSGYEPGAHGAQVRFPERALGQKEGY